jgi:hypothetical protein
MGLGGFSDFLFLRTNAFKCLAKEKWNESEEGYRLHSGKRAVQIAWPIRSHRPAPLNQDEFLKFGLKALLFLKSFQ